MVLRDHVIVAYDRGPVQDRAQLPPFAFADNIEKELNRLVASGIIEPIHYSEWGTPIVPVIKEDGTVRICGDFKVTLNPHIEVDQYPIPRIDELFVKLQGGSHFSKLDLSNVYQQILLDEKSKTLVTISTHKGFEISKMGLHTSEEKVAAINKAPVPKNVTQLKFFLGLIAYYGKSVPNLATMLHPLYNFLKNKLLTSADILVHYNPDLLVKLVTDASDYGVGYVLTQVMPNKEEKPIAYVSCVLSNGEKKYSQIEKEELAIIFGLCRLIKLASARDKRLCKVIQFIRKNWPSTITENLKPFYRIRNELSIENNCLVWNNTLIIPSDLRKNILKDLHASHMAVVKTKSLARSYLCCIPYKKNPHKAALSSWSWPTEVWSRLHLDFAGPHLGTSPAKLMFSKNLRTRFNYYLPTPNNNYNSKEDITGDSVTVPYYTMNPSKPIWIKGVILKKLGKVTYLILVSSLNITWKRHLNQIKSMHFKSALLPEKISEPTLVHGESIHEDTDSTSTDLPNGNSDSPERLKRLPKPIDRLKNYKWCENDSMYGPGTLPPFVGSEATDIQGNSPLAYFLSFFTEDIVENIVYRTNIYSGINLIMSYIKYPRLHLYWSSDEGLRMNPIENSKSEKQT
ncbi:hypothetical protein ILUMI_03744 [Ignelater luminosus]|uniref:Reverse transcriptase/retrotransposon-derived protein RNase H-like domain-containing protein n=1 Tax=Ignelater luminosus TaxID=2038154 RepID=A0A8K0GI11_IGNLU|nr:hypothetical protein ILUMI_03744 [Ignelater luminosus]